MNTASLLVERAMNGGFPELIGQGRFVTAPATSWQKHVIVDYFSLMSPLCSHHAAEYVTERNRISARMSKLHKAYRGKKKSW